MDGSKRKVLLQINTVGNSGSTGKIVESIGVLAKKNGWESYIAYGRWSNPSASHLIKIGGRLNTYLHAMYARLFDADGLGSKKATRRLIEKIEEIGPDIIQIHNLHGYYINYPILFDYLKITNIKVFWTLHDCWAFTGHCAHFERIKCRKWETKCHHCALYREYPTSIVIDKSRINFEKKKKLFSSIKDLTIIAVSDWLQGFVRSSFFKDKCVERIYSGINIDVFRDRGRYAELWPGKKVLIGVANRWVKSKGIEDYLSLSEIIPDDYIIVLVGRMEKEYLSKLPFNVIHINRTENQEELADYYSRADVSLNLSYLESFGLTTIEAAACGTPGIVYNATASPELVTPSTGIIVEAGNIDQLCEAIKYIVSKGKTNYSEACRKRVVENFNEKDQISQYVNLYEMAIYNKD